MQTQVDRRVSDGRLKPFKVREASDEEDDRYMRWILYAYHFIALLTYSHLPNGGMLLVRSMSPFDLDFLTPDVVRNIGQKEARWMDTFNAETTLLVGFIAADGTLATFRFEGEGQAAPAAIHRMHEWDGAALDEAMRMLGNPDYPKRSTMNGSHSYWMTCPRRKGA